VKKGPIDFAIGPNPIAGDSEQSCPCPVAGCFFVHSQPFVKECPRPLALRLHVRDSNVHHAVAISPHGDSRALAALQAALVLGEEIQGGGRRPVMPVDVASRRALDRRALVRRRGVAASGRAGYIGVRRASGERLIYVHHFGVRQPQDIGGEAVIEGCPRSRMSVGSRVALADTLALAITTEGAIEHRDTIKQSADALRSCIDVSAWRHPGPALLIVLTDEEKLADHFGTDALPGLAETSPELRGPILDGYVLEGLRLREPLESLLDIPWNRISAASVRMPLGGPESIAGLAPWFEMLGPLQ
jgi:hypothetical protein